MYGNLVYATPGLHGGDLGKYFKDASFGVPAGQVERTYSPRDDVTIVRDAASASRTSTAATRDGAMFGARLRDRRGPPVLHGRLPPPRARAALVVRGRRAGQPRASTRDRGRSRRTPRRTSSARPSAPARLRGGGRARSRADARQTTSPASTRYIAEARLDPTKMPGEYAAIGHPQGPDDWKRADSSRPPSWSARSSASAAATSSSRRSPCRRRDSALRTPKRARRVVADFRSVDDPEAPTTVVRSGKRFPYGAAQEAPAGRRAIARPRLGAATAEVVALEGRRAGDRGDARACSTACCAFPKAACRTRCSSPPRESQSGKPLRRLRPADRLLRAAGPDGAGRPRARHRRARRRVPGRQPLRAARPRARLRVERDHLGAGHRRHVRGRCASRLPGRPRTTASAAAACRSRCSSARTRGSRRRPTRRPPAARRCAPSAPSSASSRARRPSAASRSPSRRLRCTYVPRDRLGLGFSRFNDPERIRGARDFQRAAAHRLHLQLVLRRLGAHRLPERRREPAARAAGVDPSLPIWRHAAVRVARLDDRRPEHLDGTRRRAAPARDRPDVLRRLERQAGAAATAAADGNWGYGRLPLAAARRPASSR